MARKTMALLAFCALCLAVADARRQRDYNQDGQSSREQELIQQQVEAQERQNQKGLEQQGIDDEWRSERGSRGHRSRDDSQDDGSQYGGSKRGRRHSDDSQDDGSQYGGSKRERRHRRKHDGEDQSQQYGEDQSQQYGGDGEERRGRRHGGRRSGGDWGAEDRAGRGGKGVPATYHYYSPAYETSSLYCSDAFRNRSGRELLKRPWMAYCAHGGMSQDKCGRCARVTNLRTGASVVMLVVDMCGTGGVDMDPIGFNQIDTDGAGVRDGRMEVSVDFCGC